jgi:heat shock protein HslJ
MYRRVEMKRDGRGWIAMALVLSAGGCAGTQERAADPAVALVGPVWAVEALGEKAVLDNALITLQLDGAGHASGSGGCNRYGGPYTLEGETLRFGALAATKMACEEGVTDQEQRYFDLLAAVSRYALADDGALLLTTDDGRDIRLLRQ